MTDDILYDAQHIGFLEEIWGDGFLSPGGPDEVARVLEGVDVSRKRVMDIGSGSGACAILLARDYGAAQVIGIDVEEPVCVAARQRIDRAGVSERVEIVQVTPGPFPFEDDSFDVVFSKDSIIHIPDKAAMARDAFRVLKPGGQFAGSDWLISHDGAPSDEMADYIKEEGLEFAMASPTTYAAAMQAAGSSMSNWSIAIHGMRKSQPKNWNGYRDLNAPACRTDTARRLSIIRLRYGPSWSVSCKVVSIARIIFGAAGQRDPHIGVAG